MFRPFDSAMSEGARASEGPSLVTNEEKKEKQKKIRTSSCMKCGRSEMIAGNQGVSQDFPEDGIIIEILGR